MNALSFVPLQTVSPKASALIAKHRAQFEKNKDRYPQGLREQYEIQLKVLEDEDSPDVELLMFPFAFPDSFPEPMKPYCSLLSTLIHPFSRGTIVSTSSMRCGVSLLTVLQHIGSNDPNASPVIDPRYLEEQIDLDILVETFKFIRRVAQAEPFKQFVRAEVSPGLDKVDSDSDEQVAGLHFLLFWLHKRLDIVTVCSALQEGSLVVLA